LTIGSSSVDLRQLRYFLVVADELNFGRAAGRLGIAGPSLSQQIKALERNLKTQLFERSHHSVTLTPAGATLLPHVQALLDSADELRLLASGLGTTQPIRLGVVDKLSAEWTERVSGVAPVSIDAWVLPSHRQAARVSIGVLDLAICHVTTADLDMLELEAHLIGAERLHVISPGPEMSPVRAHEVSVLIEADVSCWLPWNNYAQQFADATGALTVGIEDGGLVGGAFLAHVRRLGRPILNCPKGPKLPLPNYVVQRPVRGPAPLWTWSLVRRRGDDRPALQAVVEALTPGAIAPDLELSALWLPPSDPHRPYKLG
jgi:DNA-binding transcriptional LysR family regulator